MNDKTMLRRVIDLETMSAAVVKSIGRAERNLLVAVREFPASTPLNGSPGGGSGGASIVVQDEDGADDRVAVSTVEAIALDDDDDLPSMDLIRLRTSARKSATCCGLLVTELVGQMPIDPGPGASLVQLAMHAYRCSIIARHEAHEDRFASMRTLSAAAYEVGRLHRTVEAWGFTPARPKRAKGQRDLMPTDLTEMWCVSCLRVGVRWPRFRKDRCEWCYRFESTEGFEVPASIVQARHEGRRITEQLVEPHRQRHRELVKRQAREERRRRPS